nr:HD domain-containing phosphohydrolase [Spirochaetota bacterium]
DYDEKTCMAYFCAALIHDIGLLDIDESFFRAEKLTDKQYEILKSHTKISADKINFIDEEYKSIFMEAITKHHENIDGSGYPNGLTDGDIPEIARMIRVVESYIALVSSRVYRNIADKQSAIGELLQNSDKYDKKIVEALDNVL